MADQAVPGRGNSGLKAVFGLVAPDVSDVSDVDVKAAEFIKETLFGLQSGSVSSVQLLGGIPDKDTLAAEEEKKDDFVQSILMSLPTIETINEWLDEAEKVISKAKRLIAEMYAVEALLDKNENGNVNWEKYGNRYLSKEQMQKTGGDPQEIIRMLQDKLVDEHGHPLDDSDLALALSLRVQAQNAVQNAQNNVDKARKAHENGAGNASTKQRVEEIQGRVDAVRIEASVDHKLELTNNINQDLGVSYRSEPITSIMCDFGNAATGEVLEDSFEDNLDDEFEGDFENPLPKPPEIMQP